MIAPSHREAFRDAWKALKSVFDWGCALHPTGELTVRGLPKPLPSMHLPLMAFGHSIHASKVEILNTPLL